MVLAQPEVLLVIGVTLGIGGEWPEIAARAARRMEKMTGISCVAITAFPKVCPTFIHPSWMKCKVIECSSGDDFLLFDADIICLKPWNPEQIFKDSGRKFCAIPDRVCQAVHQECLAFQLPYPNHYVNAGLTMFSREHAFIWQRTWERHPKFGRWLEQTALNVALKEFEDAGGGVCRLPKIYNTLPKLEDGKNVFDYPTHETKDVINFHYADLGGRTDKLIALQHKLGME